MRQLFGTDGIRAVAGEYPLDQRTVFAIDALWALVCCAAMAPGRPAC